MMRHTLNIPRLGGIRDLDESVLRKRLITEGTRGSLQSQTWEAYRADPDEVAVEFSIAYAYITVLVLFQVHEPEIRATYRNHGDPVHHDSCVELFIGQAGGIYLNVECNPFGAVLAGVGTSRHGRHLLGQEFFSHLKVSTQLGEGNESTWEALLQIPLDAAGLVHRGASLSAGSFTGNLYKCGDLLQFPHYISWNPVHTEKPDFHQSSHFGVFSFL